MPPRDSAPPWPPSGSPSRGSVSERPSPRSSARRQPERSMPTVNCSRPAHSSLIPEPIRGLLVTCPARRVRNLRSRNGQFGDHPHQHCLPRCLRNPHARHRKHRPGKPLDAIGRNRVAFCVARAPQSVLQTDGGTCPPPTAGVRPLRPSAGPRAVSEECRCRSGHARHRKQFQRTAGNATRPQTGCRTSAD